jgi:hypothetical protein
MRALARAFDNVVAPNLGCAGFFISPSQQEPKRAAAISLALLLQIKSIFSVSYAESAGRAQGF